MMNRRLPQFTDRNKVCIICEGNEEYDYLDRLIALHVWNDRYQIFLDNAKGNGNIPARYQDRYQNNSFDVVLVFCDTEKKPYEQYEDIKRKINEFHGIDTAADFVIIFGNPCTMQIILKHWDDTQLRSPAKKVNAAVIEKLTGVSNYRGKDIQRRQLMDQITVKNYQDMCERVKRLNHCDTVIGSSNFSRLIDFLSSEDANWINETNRLLQ